MPFKDENKNKEYRHNYYILNRDKFLYNQKIYRKEHPEVQIRYREKHKNDKNIRRRVKNLTPEQIQRYNITAKKSRLKRKKIVLTKYSRVNYPCCVDCGETDLRCLSIDHIGGGGYKHYKEIGQGRLYIWLKSNNFPTGYDCVCMNCNFRRRFINNNSL